MTKKIAISVTNNAGIGTPVDEHFGRAPWFLILTAAGDSASSEEFVQAEFVQNNVQDAVHGSGTRAAAILGANGVTDVISGQFGPKAYSALTQLNVRMWTAPEGLTAQEAIDAFVRGNLKAWQMKVYH